jgi:hypothetical protein
MRIRMRVGQDLRLDGRRHDQSRKHGTEREAGKSRAHIGKMNRHSPGRKYIKVKGL